MNQFSSFQVDGCGYTKIMQLMDLFCFQFIWDSTEKLAKYLRKTVNLSVQGLFAVCCVDMYILPVPKYQLELKCRRELSSKLQCVLQTGKQITITQQIFKQIVFMWHTISNRNRTTYNIVFCLLHRVFIKILQLIYLIKNKLNSPVRQTCSDRSAMSQQHTLQHRAQYVTNLKLPTEQFVKK
jgi:hypothetical protein